ncbi:MAG: GNAT family N-acetyltransferase [Alphaproteobacteria bacterium]
MSVFIRELKPEDWQLLKIVRLKALQLHRGVYFGLYEDAAAFSDQEWRDHLNGGDKAVFGLFDGNSLIGITGVFTSKHDPSGQTGVMAMSYIDPAYRGKTLSALLYKARIDWAVAYPKFKKLTIGHRADNESSKRAMLAHGFKFTVRELIFWPDGKEEWDYKYELDLEKLRGKS